MLPGIEFGFGYYRFGEAFLDVLLNTTLIIQMSVISIFIAGGLYLFDKKSNFYNLLPLAFVGVVTIKLLIDLT